MAEGTEVAKGYISIAPSLEGFRTKLQRDVSKAMREVGREAGQELGDGLERGAREGAQDAANAIDKSLDRTEKRASRVGTALKLAAAAAVGVAAVAAGRFLKDSITAASDLGESINAVNVTFGDSADGIKKLGKEAARSLGLSNKEFNQLAVQFSNFAKTVAGPGGDVVQVMDDLTTRASDFASVMNIDVAEAATLFQSGLAGETEPLRRYGIDLSAAAVEAHALATGIHDGSGEMTESQKVMARYSLLMEQTNQVAGDFANTSDSMANAQRIFKSELENTKAVAGTAFTPLIEAILPRVTELLGDMTKDLEANMPAIQEQMEKFGENIGKVIDELGGWEGIKASLEGARKEVEENWPDFEKTLNSSLETIQLLADAAGVLTEAFKKLPPEIQGVMFQLLLLSRFIKVGPWMIVIAVALEWYNNALKPLLTGEKSFLELVKERLGIGVPLLQPIGVVINSEEFDKAKEFIGEFTRGVGDTFTNLRNLVGYKMGEVGDRVAAGWEAAKRWTSEKLGELRLGVVNVWNNVFAAVSGFLSSIAQNINNGWALARQYTSDRLNELWNTARGVWDGVYNTISTAVTNIANGIRSGFQGAVDAVGRIWDTLTGKVSAPVRLTLEFVNNSVIDKMNAVLSKVSPSLTIPRIPGYAQGGYVTGPGGPVEDKITARLSNGEFVVNAKATRDNRALLEAINAGRQGYGIGGPLDWLSNAWDGASAAAGWVMDKLTQGVGTLVRALTTPAIAALRSGFGGRGVFPDMAIESVAKLLRVMETRGDAEDAASAGGYAGPIQAGNFVRPANGPVTSEFGMRWGRLHAGIDIGAPTGAPIRAIAAGRAVATTGMGWNGGYGNMVSIDHGGGFSTRYAHASALTVRLGQIVRAGQQIAKIGSTGDSTGPHLHFETRFGGSARNPRSVLPFDNGGFLPPGLSMAFNGTGKPEPVLTDKQWKAMADAGPRYTFNVAATQVPTEDAMLAALRRADAIYGGA